METLINILSVAVFSFYQKIKNPIFKKCLKTLKSDRANIEPVGGDFDLGVKWPLQRLFGMSKWTTFVEVIFLSGQALRSQVKVECRGRFYDLSKNSTL